MGSFSAEWEWGWQTPLLLKLPASLPSVAASFIDSPLGAFDLPQAEVTLRNRLDLLKSSRIGLRYERIQEALFLSHPATRSLRAGIVIPGRTEIDLLQEFHGAPNAWFHWEVAVKFYLALDDAGSTNPDRWIGPTLRDTFGIKSRAIFSRQLSVLEDPCVRDFVGIPATDAVFASPYVRGILFLPWRKRSREAESPPGVNPRGQRGYWVEASEMDAFQSEVRESKPGGAFLLFQDRKDWIKTHSADEPTTGDLKSFFKVKLAKPSRADLEADLAFPPFQGSYVLPSGTGDGRNETRFFCVPDGWREKAERALETLRRVGKIKA